MTESEYQTLLAAIVEASDARYDAAKVVLTKLMGEGVRNTHARRTNAELAADILPYLTLTGYAADSLGELVSRAERANR